MQIRLFSGVDEYFIKYNNANAWLAILKHSIPIKS